MKTVCRQKKVWWVERTMDMSLGGEEIEKEDPESSSGWQNTTLTARKLVFPTHCVYAIHWTTEACPLIEGSMRRFFYCSYQASSSPRRCNNTIIRRIKICHPRGGGDLVFLYLSLCLYVFCPPSLKASFSSPARYIVALSRGLERELCHNCRKKKILNQVQDDKIQPHACKIVFPLIEGD